VWLKEEEEEEEEEFFLLFSTEEIPTRHSRNRPSRFKVC